MGGLPGGRASGPGGPAGRLIRRARSAGGRVRQALKSGGAKAGSRPVSSHEPAYPLGPRFAGPRQGLAGGCAPFDPPEVRAPAERVVMADRHTVPPPPAYRWPSLPACGPRPVPQGGRVPDFTGAAYLADEPRPGGQRDPLIRRAPSGAQWPSRQGIHGPGATPGGRGPSCENTLGSEPVPSPRGGGSLPSTSVLPSAARTTGWRRTQLQATARDR